MFEELEEMGVQVREEDKYEKWFACFDFEAYQCDFDEKVDAVEENSLQVEEGTSSNKVHVPVSFSVGCNVDGVETCHVSSKDPGELVSQFVAILLEKGEKKYRAAVECLNIFSNSCNKQVDFLDDDDDDMEMDHDDNVMSEGMKKLDKLYKKFEAYCKELVVFGFNSAGYDIKLIKKHLFKELCEHGQQPTFTVKKSRKYHCIKTDHLKFLDVLQFLAPGCNYFVSAEQLDETTLPPMKLFTQLSRTATSWKKNTLCFKNWSMKEHPNKKPSKYYVELPSQKLALRIISGFESYGLKISGQLFLIFLNGITIWM